MLRKLLHIYQKLSFNFKIVPKSKPVLRFSAENVDGLLFVGGWLFSKKILSNKSWQMGQQILNLNKFKTVKTWTFLGGDESISSFLFRKRWRKFLAQHGKNIVAVLNVHLEKLSCLLDGNFSRWERFRWAGMALIHLIGSLFTFKSI